MSFISNFDMKCDCCNNPAKGWLNYHNEEGLLDVMKVCEECA